MSKLKLDPETREQKTFQDALKTVPIALRDPLTRLWKATQVMDLYDGDMSQYIDVAAQKLEATTYSIQWAKENLRKASFQIEHIQKAI